MFRDENYGFVGPIFILMFISVIGGSLLSWVILSTPSIICLPLYIKVLALVVRIIGGWMGFELSMIITYGRFCLENNYLVRFLGSIWFIPYISTYVIRSYPLYGGLRIARVSDGGWREEIGGQGIFNIFLRMRIVNQEYQFNYFKYYLLRFIFWLFIFVILLIYSGR